MTDNLDWRVDESRHLVHDRWISLRADTCTTSTGTTLSPYYVLEYPNWVSVFAVDVHNQVIVTSEYHHGARTTGIGLPGGGLDSEDGHPGEGILREFREETGYQVGELIDLGAVWANWGNHTNLVHNYLAVGCTPAGAQELDDTEAITVEQIPLDQFRTDQLPQAYHRLNAYMALERLQDRAQAAIEAVAISDHSCQRKEPS